MKLFWEALLYLVVFTSLSFGQVSRTATLVGTVTDPSGALVPGAKVTLTNLDTGFVSNGVTNAEGNYYIPFLAVGNYQLAVEAAGFKVYVQKGIQLRAAETPRINVKLEVGATSESVQVTGAAPLLATENSQVSQTMEAKTIMEIPVHQMKVQRLMYYVEGVQMRGSDASIVGQPASAIGFTLDGISGKTSVGSAIGDTNTSVQPALDALAEAKVYSTGTPAEMGHASGGILAMTFKSGTNALHGSLEDRWTNNVMTHRTYLQQGSLFPMTFHQMLATINGPVVIPKVYNGKNKTFFLFAFGRHQEKSNEQQTGTTPDLNMLAGDFSFPQATGGGYPIYDPKSMTLSGTTWTATPFSGMQVPKSRFDPVVNNFLATVPWLAPNQLATYSRTGPSNNYLGLTHYRSYRSRYDSKLDQEITPKNKFFLRSSWNRHRQPEVRFQAFLANHLLDTAAPGRPEPIDQQNWAFADYHTFSPTLMNELRLGFERRNDTVSPPTAGQGWAQKLGVPNVGPENFPMFQSGTSALYGIGPGAYTRTTNEEVTLQNNVTKLLSKHTIKFGYELIRARANIVSQVLPSGSYSFQTNGTALPFTPNTGNIFASFLLGSVTSATYTQMIWNQLPRWWSHAGYVQTDWKVKRNLTLNLGLRYTLETPFQDKWGHQSQFNPKVVDPLTGMMGAITHPTGALYATDKNNFQPRVGVAWNFNSKMVFRGSFGMLTQDLMPSAGSQEYTATAVVQQVTGDPRPAFYLSQGPPNRNFVINPDGTSPFLGTNYSGRNATYIDPNVRLPYVMNWAGGVQTQMGPTWLTELMYQGSSGVHLNTSGNINQLANSYYTSTDLTLLNAVYAATQNYKPYPQFGTISYITNAGHNTYHGLTARLEKRYAPDGLTLNLLYTWSKNLSGTQGDGWQYYNWGLTKAPTSFDTRHRLVLQGMYDLPVGKGRKLLSNGGWLSQVIGGWNLLVTASPQSGPPVTFTYAGSPSKYLSGGPSWPNLIQPSDQVYVSNWSIGDHRFPQSAQNPYYNINAFAYPAQFTAGTLGAGRFRGRFSMSNQWSISKHWAWERYKFTIRLDANNIPVRNSSITPDTAVNLSSPATFAKFGLSSGASYSTMDQGNGQLIISGRFEF